jgi:glyoxylase-like metal-dependent hydrolase (beta-lactamase superfamily II)
MHDTPPRDLPVADDNWFAIEARDENGVRRIREVHVHDYGGGNIWLVEGEDRCLLVETGLGVKSLRQFVETVTDKPVIAFASLGYYDHAGGLHQFDERWIHRADQDRVTAPTRHNTAAERYLGGAFRALPYAGFDPATYVMPASQPTRLLEDGDQIDLGGRQFEVLHLPGVTAGACGLFERATGVFFSGEALIWGDDYVYDGEPPDISDDADRDAFRTSLARIAALPATAVYPGHHDRTDASAMRAAIDGYLAGVTVKTAPGDYVGL